LPNNNESAIVPKFKKLGPRFVGPYKILEHIGAVAYKLELPAGAHIHDVFHVGVLKPFHGTPPAETPHLPPLQDGRLLPPPERVLHASLRRGTRHVLVQWAGMSSGEATWEPVDSFRSEYPVFQLEDELFFEEARDVMVGKVYQRRRSG